MIPEPDLATRLADAILAEKTKLAARGDRFMRSDVIRVLRACLALEPVPAHPKKKPAAKGSRPSSLPDELWLATLETEPHLAGVDIQAQLAAAQFWCKNNHKVCTRRRFVNWLNNAERKIILAPGGPTGKKPDLYREPDNWRTSEAARAALRLSKDSWALVVARKWADLGTDIRADVLKAL